jgi:hypothetical protein
MNVNTAIANAGMLAWQKRVAQNGILAGERNRLSKLLVERLEDLEHPLEIPLDVQLGGLFETFVPVTSQGTPTHEDTIYAHIPMTHFNACG